MRAFLVEELDGRLTCEVGEIEPRPREPSDLLVKVDFSGINFKDALVATPQSRVRRVPRLVGGVDAAGVVVESTDLDLPVGTRVAVHGGDLGVGRDGGFAEYLYTPSRFVTALPDAINTRDAMIIGTAGFTSMASILALEDHGLDRDGEVLVTGATGGVGSMAVAFLATMGYRPVASTGSAREAPWLYERGATLVIGRDEIDDRAERVLGSERWSGAIDCIGGVTLQQILRSLRYGAAVAASGLVAGTELNTTIYPFITRSVSLLGIDAVGVSSFTRARVWTALGEIAPLIDFAPLTHRTVTLEQLSDALEEIRNSDTRGRILVRPTPG